MNAIASLHPDDTITLGIVRRGKELELEGKVGERKARPHGDFRQPRT